MGKKISMDEETFYKILDELKNIEVLTSEGMTRKKVHSIVSIMENINKNIEKRPVIDIIYEKMKESKTKNPELNVRLYILYRDLQGNKVSEEKALQLYNEYLQLYPDDTIVY